MAGRKRPQGSRYTVYGRPDRRGGARPNAGGPKGAKWTAEQKAAFAARRAKRMTDDDVARLGAAQRAFAASDASIEDVAALARKFSPNAMRVLALVAATGKSENARVAAAAKIIEIDRANRTDDEPALAPLGKKEMQLEAAKLAASAVDWGDDLQPRTYRN
jgi:hypothetical protein